MEKGLKGVIGIGLVAAVLIVVAAAPALAAPASQTYQVATDKKIDQAGQPLRVIATVKQGVSSCTYSVMLTVTGPGGVSATATTSLTTLAGGDGHVSTTFPSGFSGVANTNTPGTYTVTATFICGYTTGFASTTFSVAH